MSPGGRPQWIGRVLKRFKLKTIVIYTRPFLIVKKAGVVPQFEEVLPLLEC